MQPRSSGVLAVLVAVCAGLRVDAVAADSADWWDGGLSVAQRALRECEAAKDVAACLKTKAVRAMDRALSTDAVPLFAGVSLVQRGDASPSRSARKLPAVPQQPRATQLDDLLLGRIARFLETRSLQVSLPKVADTVEDVFEGRGKLKKLAGPAILIMVMAAYKLAMMMAGVAMLSGKALIVSKVALTLAGVAVLKKLLSHGEGHEKTTVEIVKTPQVSHSHSYTHHDEHDHGYNDKSWNVGPMAGYTHRSLAGMVDDGVDSLGAQPAALMPQDIATKRDYRSVPGPAMAGLSPLSYVTGGGVETLSIHSHEPLRIVVADNGEEDIRVHHRQRQLDLASPALGVVEEPNDYSQFGEADTGAWRGLGNALPVSDSRSLRSAPSSEQQERSLDGSVKVDNSDYQPRSLSGSYSIRNTQTAAGA